MQIPKLNSIEYLIEEGRWPSMLYSIGALLGTLALVIALFAFSTIRTAIESDLTNIIITLTVVGGGASAWKNWLNYKNGKSTPPAQPTTPGA